MLKELAAAPTLEAFEHRLAKLASSDLYSERVKSYLEREWLQPETRRMWAWYARQAFHGGINTNNYVESMNRVIKEKWLRQRSERKLRLETLLRVVLNDILPNYRNNYMYSNINSDRCVSNLQGLG